MTVKDHYDYHLADFYSWMIGDFEKNKDSFKEFCINQQIEPNKTGKAIDLGAGNGIQSVALAEIGFKVLAVDFSDKLLAELKNQTNGLPIELKKGDIRNLTEIVNSSVDLIICCGDTISHLESFAQLEKLIQDCYDLLEENGYLLLTFRDYSFELSDTERFIPVKSDESRILTCVIEYFTEKIRVTDLLYEKDKGTWVPKISSYDKLRISTEYVVNISLKTGFSIIENKNINRMMYLILKK